jgi:hypothetical protein
MQAPYPAVVSLEQAFCHRPKTFPGHCSCLHFFGHIPRQGPRLGGELQGSWFLLNRRCRGGLTILVMGDAALVLLGHEDLLFMDMDKSRLSMVSRPPNFLALFIIGTSLPWTD